MSDTPQPLTFADFKLNKQLLNAVAEAGFEQPTPVQEQTIPLLLAGHDVLGIAQTGTGKTAAFGLPLLMKVKYAQGTHPRGLILAPTRELAMQIETHLKKMAVYTDLRILAIYGGLGPKTQIETLAAGVDILIATPGRLMELYLKGAVIFKELKTLVLDEADKMMDMGFMPQIRAILEVIPRKRQNALFSATMPERVVRLSEEFLEFPMRVEVTPAATSAQNVSQTIYRVPNLLTKINLLGYLFKDAETFNRVMIFCRTKEHADNVAHFLGRKVAGEVRAIHGNKGQNVRINSMEAFRNGELRFLVATDVAARGIDVPQVSHVINFDVPLVYDDYVHRIGRTGRAQHTGAAITFANEAEMHHIGRIEELINQPIPELPLPPDVKVMDTMFDEKQSMAREIDDRRKKLDPEYQGAFHDKVTPLQKGIDKRTGLPYVEGPNRSQKGKKKRASPGRSQSPAAKGAAKLRNARRSR
ncbi:DEAD/DEAH box helicase [Hymenobacter cellulosilyticus]|uniref:DEAD/DEAH box helicase n=1 Tax=Hymenobacter cellulosilyticus TaxID=2932248 RepID=A0A8T9QA71_9BACT|nr:DEAD/DEAH box helicase [Hymenobacter cellulosilyticus]UOQ73882.1 DEAD/DEAH box helicase [Hymenobacter cellulosilyticus]